MSVWEHAAVNKILLEVSIIRADASGIKGIRRMLTI